MPSFDVVSKIDRHELSNALDQANREVGNRFDFKGSDVKFTEADGIITLNSETEMQLQQMLDILFNKISKRGIDLGALETGEPQASGKRMLQKVTIRQGIDKELGRKIVKFVKESKMKMQASIQSEQVRITGKKRDDLQDMISKLTSADLGLPLQFENFRD
ncbi:MAG: YajQ family cyclic di-GMP-binding protein [Acidiferrobacterales bacterium]